MEERIREALGRDRVIDITTTGRTSGQPRRIEMWFHNLDGRVYLTGLPGPRDWHANVLANPGLTIHFKERVIADLAGRATPITEPNERRAILSRILAKLDRSGDLEAWEAGSPLVRVDFEED